jgi:cell division protein FtsN
VQVDAVSDKAAADEMLRRIASLGFKACEKTITVNGEKQYAVRIGPYATADEAAAAQEKLHQQYKAAFSDPDS